MRLNDTTTINGIFNYDSSVEYTEGDFIIYNGLLYKVISDTNSSSNPPDRNSRYLEYSRLNSTNNIAVGDNKLVTAEAVKKYIDNYLNGLNYGGTIKSIHVNSFNPDNYAIQAGNHIFRIDFTGISQGDINNLVEPIRTLEGNQGSATPDKLKYLFKSFRFSDGNFYYALQELTEFYEGKYSTRVLKLDNSGSSIVSDPNYPGTWKSVSGNGVTLTSDRLTKIHQMHNDIRLCGFVNLNIQPNNRSIEINKSLIENLNLKYIDVEVNYRLNTEVAVTQDIVRFNANQDGIIDKVDYRITYILNDQNKYVITIYRNETPLDVDRIEKVIGIKYLDNE